MEWNWTQERGERQRSGFLVRVRFCFTRAGRYEMMQVLDDMMPEFEPKEIVGEMIVSFAQNMEWSIYRPCGGIGTATGKREEEKTTSMWFLL